MAKLGAVRVVEIWSSNAGSTGTGYVLGNGLVLTARHVVDRDKTGTTPDKVIARLAGQTEWCHASVAWPTDPAELANHEVDAALIRVVEWRDKAASARVGPADDEIGSKVRVGAVGFPGFCEDPATRKRDTDEIAGIVFPGATIERGRYQIENITFRNEAANMEVLDWSGMSGAALVSGGRIIGVVITSKVGQRYQFSAVRMDRILAAPGFREIAGPAIVVDGAQQSAPVDLARLTCLLGRDPQESRFNRFYDEAVVEGAPLKAMLVLIPGARDGEHCPEDLSLRFSLRSLTRKQWPESDWVWLRWLDDTDKAYVLADLRDALWEALCSDPTKPTPLEPEPFRTLLQNGRPRLFKSNLTGLAPTLGLAQIIAEWSRFWGALSNLVDRRPPIHLLLVQPPDQHATEQWLAQAPGFEGTVLRPLPPLADCTRFDYRAWVDDRLKAHLDERTRARLERALSPTYDQDATFKMLRIKNAVREIPADV